MIWNKNITKSPQLFYKSNKFLLSLSAKYPYLCGSANFERKWVNNHTKRELLKYLEHEYTTCATLMLPFRATH